MLNTGDRALTRAVRDLALTSGASLVGFADVAGIAPLPRGVAIAIRHSPQVFSDPSDMPNPAYSQEYWELNARLTEMAQQIAARLDEAGYRASAHPATRYKVDPQTLAAPFPHKTAATRAGMGWVGKCALLVTEEYGPALRLGSVLTDAPLVVGGADHRESMRGVYDLRRCLPGARHHGRALVPGDARARRCSTRECVTGRVTSAQSP